MAKIPHRNDEIASLGVRVVTNWANYPTLTLSWITQTDAATLVANFHNTILQTSETMGNERDKIRTMQALDKEINLNLNNLKKLIEMEYGKTNLQSHYADFGIKRYYGTFTISRDRDSRLQALRLIVSRLATAPFSGSIFGLAYWQNILTQYELEIVALSSEVAKVSGDVADKNILKKEVLKLLKSMKHLIIADYPDTYTRVLRDFGYLDEYI